MSRLHSAINKMHGSIRDVAGVTVSIKRGDEVHNDITVTPGETPFRTEDMSGRSILVRSRDYLVGVDDYPWEQPQRGDQIIDESGNCYEVMSPNDEDVWRYSTTAESVFRIHTKHVGRI